MKPLFQTRLQTKFQQEQEQQHIDRLCQNTVFTQIRILAKTVGQLLPSNLSDHFVSFADAADVSSRCQRL